ncbi:hypothetical protein L7F22_024631 [Adiantum nelumboides]|nr:hypothetical protein [Adiantum nelumboides]
MSNNTREVQKEITKKTILCFQNPNQNASSVSVPKVPKYPWRLRSLKRGTKHDGGNKALEVQNGNDHVRVEISNEDSDLLGKVLFNGQLAVDKKTIKEDVEPVYVAAKLTTKEFTWARASLKLEDVVAVSYSDGTRRFTVHTFPFPNSTIPFQKRLRKRKDSHFLALNSEEALNWTEAFESLKFYVNHSPHPLPSAKRQNSKLDAQDLPSVVAPCCRIGRAMLVILNPRSGRGRARKVYDSEVEPILKLAGFKLNVVETNGAHHAQKLAATVDLSTCSSGIICVGGDGIVNEVLNGLLSREDAKQSRVVPIGIIPAGSDNSLIWSIMGIRDPASAAVAIVKGDLISTDIFAVEWTKTGDVHMGLTVAYYGFMSDVLELSEKYQKRFGPLRYFVAGALKFLCLPRYECEVEYLPVGGQDNQGQAESKGPHLEIFIDDTLGDNAGADTGSKITTNGSFNHDSPFRTASEHDLFSGTTDANNEPSEYVRGLDGKSKRPSSGRGSSVQTGNENVVAVNHSVAGATSPSPRPRTRTKSRLDRGWSGMSPGNGSLRSSWDYSIVDDHPVDLFSTSNETAQVLDTNGVSEADGVLAKPTSKQGLPQSHDADNEKWVVKQGPFLGIMVCNHQCKTVQCLNSQLLAPTAEHDDRRLDLVLVHKVGRLQLLRFLVLMQFGRHLSLPFVEYTKVRSVKLKPGNNHHKGCGIDGELMPLNGPISTTILDEQCQLIGHTVFRH